MLQINIDITDFREPSGLFRIFLVSFILFYLGIVKF